MQNLITCLSADNDVFPFQRTENNRRQCRHRKVATRQTLPTIQTSLSLKKVSMATKTKALPSPSAQVVSNFSVSTSGLVWLTTGQTFGPLIQNVEVLEPRKPPKRRLLSSSRPTHKCGGLVVEQAGAEPTMDPSRRLPSQPLSTPSFSPLPPWTKKERTCRLPEENLTGGVGFQGVVTVRRFGRRLPLLLLLLLVC